MVSITTLSTHFGFSSVYPGFLVYETPMIDSKRGYIFKLYKGLCHCGSNSKTWIPFVFRRIRVGFVLQKDYGAYVGNGKDP